MVEGGIGKSEEAENVDAVKMADDMLVVEGSDDCNCYGLAVGLAVMEAELDEGLNSRWSWAMSPSSEQSDVDSKPFDQRPASTTRLTSASGDNAPV